MAQSEIDVKSAGCGKREESPCATSGSPPRITSSGEWNVRPGVIMELRKLYGCTYEDFFQGLDSRE